MISSIGTPIPQAGETYCLRDYPKDVIVEVRGKVMMRTANHLQSWGVVYRRTGEDHDTARDVGEFNRLFQRMSRVLK